MTLILESEDLHIAFHPRGAAIDHLIYKPLGYNLVLPCDQREAAHHYANTIVGPVANRIHNGRFAIDHVEFQSNQNEGKTTLHGGALGVSELEWQLLSKDDTEITFGCRLEDGHMGFPGPSDLTVRYHLNGNALTISLKAQSPRRNYFNLAPHLYLNLDNSATIDRHELSIQAGQFLPVDGDKIPRAAEAVAGKTFDFRHSKALTGIALDHNFCLDDSGMRVVAKLRGSSGLQMTLETNQTGLQIYTHDHANRTHLAIEPQDWPNALNRTDRPISWTEKDQCYENLSRWIFEKC